MIGDSSEHIGIFPHLWVAAHQSRITKRKQKNSPRQIKVGKSIETASRETFNRGISRSFSLNNMGN